MAAVGDAGCGFEQHLEASYQALHDVLPNDARNHSFLRSDALLAIVFVADEDDCSAPGDTDLFDGMAALAPGLDVALLPISGWGARVPAGHLDPRRAAEALRRLRPRIAVLIHWGTYRRVDMRKRDELLRAPADEFARLAAEHAPDVDVRILSVGESLDVPVSSAVGAQP
jgi:L-ascorbate metabolism protein UlaG (beta-lactamase superfamily)